MKIDACVSVSVFDSLVSARACVCAHWCDSCVALHVRQAAILIGADKEALRDILTLDVIPRSVGVEVGGGAYEVHDNDRGCSVARCRIHTCSLAHTDPQTHARRRTHTQERNDTHTHTQRSDMHRVSTAKPTHPRTNKLSKDAHTCSRNLLPHRSSVWFACTLPPSPPPAGQVIIPRNSKIPCKFTRQFRTVVDDQPNLRVVIYEGENPVARDNQLLTEMRVVIPRDRRGPAGKEVRAAMTRLETCSTAHTD